MRCAGAPVQPLGVQPSGNTGAYSLSNVASLAGVNAGETRYFQAWDRDPTGPCGGTTNVTSAVAVAFQP